MAASYTVYSAIKDSVPGLKMRAVIIVGDAAIPATTGYIKPWADLGFSDVYGATTSLDQNGTYVIKPDISTSDSSLHIKYYVFSSGVIAAGNEAGVNGSKGRFLVWGV